MAKNNRILVIGGVACGPKAAARARRCDPQAQITIVEEGGLISYAGCGLPYYLSGVIKKRSALLARTTQHFKSVNNIDVLTSTRAESIDRAGHKVEIVNLENNQRSTLEYDKLVIATGASPVVPPIKGRELGGIHVLKDVPDADGILNLLNSPGIKKAVVVGAGLIGMEMVEALVEKGLEVTLVEALDRLLPAALDEEIASMLACYLQRKGVCIRLGEKVVRFDGEDGQVKRAVTEKETLNADIVIVAIGVRPNVKLAREVGLKLEATGAIAVNEYLQTSDPDIYAGGDCVDNCNLVTGARIYAPMGSTANKHGRVIGTNVAGGRETFPGVLGTTVLRVFDYNVGRTGLGERQAQDAGFDVVTALMPAPDHATYYPGAKDILLKLIVDRKTGRLLGGQGVGRGDLAKRIDVLATALAFGGTVDALCNLDLAYAPPYNQALDPIHNVANIIRNKLAGMTQGLTPAQVKAKLDRNEDFVLLDVRSQKEWENWRIEAPQVKLVPQPNLRERLGELPRDKEIVTICRRGARAYQAQRVLKGEGFKDVKFMEGSMTAWPFDCLGEEPEE